MNWYYVAVTAGMMLLGFVVGRVTGNTEKVTPDEYDQLLRRLEEERERGEH